MKRLFFLTLYIIFLFTIANQKAFAKADFLSDYAIIYSIDDNGLTHATINGTITNQTSKIYADKYRIDLGFSDIENVKASDSKGLIVPMVTKSARGNSIQLAFNDRVVGLNNKLHFKITFDTFNVAQKNGKIWEVNIPGLIDQEDFNSLLISVLVPSSFGRPSLIKPAQATSSLTFTKEQLGASGISISFGSRQIYNLNLDYHINNTNVFPIKTEIALPPSTNYQDVYLSNITPQPQNISLDNDGNWLAEYYLLPSQKMDIAVSEIVSISLQPKKELLTDNQRKSYLAEQPFWQTSNPQIIETAKKLKTPQAIYSYVVRALTYDPQRVTKNEPRAGAVNVLENPSSAVCLEFTDLFVTLSRAAGIPAREVDGYGYTTNPSEQPVSTGRDILHAWPEYYDSSQQKWIMVDPTWGNTTNGVDYFHALDFDHIAFVVRGIDSNYPIPAGGYKLSANTNEKDVNVTFANSMPTMTEQLTFSPKTNVEYLSWLPITSMIEVSNSGRVLVHPQSMIINSPLLSKSGLVISLPAIPPYGSIDTNITFNKVAFLTNQTYPFTIRLANKSLTGYINIKPIIINKEIVIGGIIFVLFTIIIFIFARKAWRLPVSR